MTAAIPGVEGDRLRRRPLFARLEAVEQARSGREPQYLVTSPA